MKIVLTGRAGQVGSALERALAPLGELRAYSREELDLRDAGSLKAALRSEKPAVIVNAAAYTAVDTAEREKELAFGVNARAVQALAGEAKSLGALLIHFSTDYVFDGTKAGAYLESDPANPINVYGQSKLEGERAVAASGCRHFIFRTSWVYGPAGRNFLLAILAAAKTKPELRVVADQHGAPTSSLAIADAMAKLLSNPGLERMPGGLYHLCAAGETTWHGFAEAILSARGLKTPVVAIRSDEFSTTAKRPKNSRLNCARAAGALGLSMPGWSEGLAEVLNAASF